MVIASNQDQAPRPIIVPLGDSAVLVRFDDTLSDAANRAAIDLALALTDEPLPGVVEIVPNLVSVLLRYDPARTPLSQLAGELRLRLATASGRAAAAIAHHHIAVQFGGDGGPDLKAAATAVGLTVAAFISAHNSSTLRVLATGFAPGFVYCGFHPPALIVPRLATVRPSVPAGSVLFAAGQTAIAATAIPTGWYVIGTTAFRNFDPEATSPAQLRAGDSIDFASAS